MESSKTPFSGKNGALGVSAHNLEMPKGKSCLRNPPTVRCQRTTTRVTPEVSLLKTNRGHSGSCQPPLKPQGTKGQTPDCAENMGQGGHEPRGG